MGDYVRNNPLSEGELYVDGTAVHDVAQLGRKNYVSPGFAKRLPAFVALAKSTGGVYAENEAGMTPQRALEAAGLDYTVSFQGPPTTTIMDETGVETVVGNHLRTTVGTWPIGDDGRHTKPRTMFGVVGSKYAIFQPTQLAELGQECIDETGANCIAAGAYGAPMYSRLYLAFKLPTSIKIGGEDPVDMYLSLGASHDGSTSAWGTIAPIRLACTNQLTMTFGKLANRFSIRHSGDMTNKALRMREALDITNTWTEQFTKACDKLLTRRLTPVELRQFVEAALPTPKGTKTESGAQVWEDRRGQIIKLARESDTCEFGRGTAYAAYQAFTEWADWLRPARGEAKDETVRFSRVVAGDEGERWKVRAADLLLAN